MKATHTDDGDIFICIQVAMTTDSIQMSTAHPDPARAEQWRQKRNAARLRLDEKRNRWKASRVSSHYPDRQVKAQGRLRVGGRFVKEQHQQFQPFTSEITSA